jgi:hypothetical protein
MITVFPGNYFSSGSPSMSITSEMADSGACFFDPLPRCDFGFRFFFSFGFAAASRLAWQSVQVQVRGWTESDL